MEVVVFLRPIKLSKRQQVRQFISVEHVEIAPTLTQQKAVKAPKKELQGMNWLVANISNGKVEFSSGQVQMKHGIFIENCKDCGITILDKFKSLQMSNCSNITLLVDSCVSGVEVMNG
jgi:adenylyl cyclase-associated protein